MTIHFRVICCFTLSNYDHHYVILAHSKSYKIHFFLPFPPIFILLSLYPSHSSLFRLPQNYLIIKRTHLLIQSLFHGQYFCSFYLLPQFIYICIFIYILFYTNLIPLVHPDYPNHFVLIHLIQKCPKCPAK